MQVQYSVLRYGLDLYFCNNKLAIEIVENGYCDKNIDYKLKGKKQYNMTLVVSLLQLILTKKNLILQKLSMKYLGTSNERLIN